LLEFDSDASDDESPTDKRKASKSKSKYEVDKPWAPDGMTDDDDSQVRLDVI